MCGICGYIHFDRTKAADESVLKAMTDTMVHRGPDDSGLFVGANAALGHRRLAIIDLKTGHQPLFNEDKSIAIVCNGEVYNFKEIRKELEKRGHRFATSSDTEVIVHAYEEYGEDCVKKFNGMFAFCVWDKKRGRLFLARDRFGKKPLYYGVFNNQFIFGSEIKALLKHPDTKREIDMASVTRYLSYDYIPAPRSIFKDIYKLEAGCRLTVEGARVKYDPYWEIDPGPECLFDPAEARERIFSLFKRSVERRLISDVPLGVFLSGGIDSSCVVAAMAELMNPKDIKTFSVAFKDASYDESHAARTVAGRFGTDHKEKILEPDTMLDVLPKVIDEMDEPFADSSIIPTYLVSNFTRQYVTVALGGDGGDELFLGYPSFYAHKIRASLNALPAWLKAAALLPLKVFSKASRASYGATTLSSKAKRFVRGFDFPESISHQIWAGSFTPKGQSEIFLKGNGLDYDPYTIYGPTKYYFEKALDRDPMARAMYIYIKTYLTDDILAKVDRASMANSLEVRAPFLDTDFAEFAAKIPAVYKLKGLNPKWILKEAFRDKLPGGILARQKHGFAVPVGRWMRRELKGVLTDAVRKDKIAKEGIFDPEAVEEMTGAYLSGKTCNEREIWSIFMFELWYNRWIK